MYSHVRDRLGQSRASQGSEQNRQPQITRNHDLFLSWIRHWALAADAPCRRTTAGRIARIFRILGIAVYRPENTTWRIGMVW
jgi:hypothetical protein